MTQGPPTTPPRFLLTGFGPFGEFATNPSWELARRFQDLTISMVRIETAELPVTWAGAWPALEAAIARVRPRWVLLLGVGGTRTRAGAEVRARNYTNPIPDTAGALPPPGDVIRPGAPPYRTATLPAPLIAERFQTAGVPAEVSTDAGGFLCNWTLYHALEAAPRLPGVRGIGFVHVPPVTAPADLAALERGLRAVVDGIVAGAAPLYALVEAEIEAERQGEEAARG